MSVLTMEVGALVMHWPASGDLDGDSLGYVAEYPVLNEDGDEYIKLVRVRWVWGAHAEYVGTDEVSLIAPTPAQSAAALRAALDDRVTS